MRSAMEPTLSASYKRGWLRAIRVRERRQTSRQRMVAWGMPKALTGSPGIEQRSMRSLGSSHKVSSSLSWTWSGGRGRTQGLLRADSGRRRPLRASKEMNLS